MQFDFWPRETNIKEPASFPQSGASCASARDASVVHPEQDNNREFAPLGTMQCGKVYPVITFAESGKQAKRHVWHVATWTCSVNECVKCHAFFSQGPAVVYKFLHKARAKVLQPSMQARKAVCAEN